MNDENTKWYEGISPGTILKEDYMEPFGISAYKLAQGIGVSQTAISEIIKGKRRITPDTAIKLALFFNTDAESWMNLQTFFDLEAVKKEKLDEYKKSVKPFVTA